MRMKSYGLRSISVRIMAVAVTAALASGAIATYVSWRAMSDTAEVKLVEAASADVDRARTAILGRLDVAEAQLTAAALLANSDRIQEVPIALSEFVCATRVVGARETLEVIRHEEARGLLPRDDSGHRGRWFAGDHAVLRVEAGDSVVTGVVEIASLFPADGGDTVLEYGADAQLDIAGVVVTRGSDSAVARSSLRGGMILRHEVSLSGARAEAHAQLRRAVGWTAGITLVIVLVLAWVLARWVTSPIRKLATAVANGRQRLVLPELAHDEIGELGSVVESMHRSLANDAHQLAVGADLAHAVVRLQDPEEVLARLRSALEAAHPAQRWEVHVRDAAERQTEAARALHGDRAVIVPIVDGASQVGVAIGVGDATEAERRSVEVLCHTAFAAITTIELMRAAAVNDKLAVLGRMSAGVAHEINNPLAFVSLSLGLLEEQLTGEQHELVRDAISGVERVARIVRDLSSVTRAGSEASTREDLVAIVGEQVKIAKARLGNVSLVFTPPPPVFVSCVRARVGQAILNLIINAIDAVSSQNDGRVELVVSGDDVHGQLLVRDNGPGIPEHSRGQLFDAFFSTKGDRGTGLGLYLSRKFIEMQNGTLGVVTTGPTGTTFQLQLQHAPPEHGVVDAETIAIGSGPMRRRVLVIDDEPQITRTLQRWLSKYVDVVTASGGREGIERFEQSHYALVLCDWNMPDVSGAAFVERVRQTRPHFLDRVVVMTGGVADDIRGVRVLHKPLDREAIKDLLGV